MATHCCNPSISAAELPSSLMSFVTAHTINSRQILWKVFRMVLEIISLSWPQFSQPKIPTHQQISANRSRIKTEVDWSSSNVISTSPVHLHMQTQMCSAIHISGTFRSPDYFAFTPKENVWIEKMAWHFHAGVCPRPYSSGAKHRGKHGGHPLVTQPHGLKAILGQWPNY